MMVCTLCRIDRYDYCLWCRLIGKCPIPFDLERCNDSQKQMEEGREGKRKGRKRSLCSWGVDMWARTLRLDVTLHEKMVSPNQS